MIKRSFLKTFESVFYFYSAICFFYFINVFSADFQDFSHTVKMFPVYISLLLPVYLLFITHLALYPQSEKKLVLTYRVNGIVFSGLSLFGAIMLIVYATNGTYNGFLQGGITSLFPLDMIILNFVFALAGGYLVYLSFKKKPEGPYFPSRHGTARKIFSSIFRPLLVLFAIYHLGSFIFGLYDANYGGTYEGYMIPLYILMLVPSLMLGFYEWGYKDGGTFQNEEKRTALSWSLFGSTLLLSVLMVVFLVIEPDYILEEAIAFYPLDFMGSYNIAPIILSLPALIAEAVAIIDLYMQKKRNQAR